MHQGNNGGRPTTQIGAAVTATATPLTQDEAEALDRYEVVIRRGLKTFTEVGAALLAIRDRRLYRTTHATFEDYCRATWQISDRRARQLIEAAAVVDELEDQTGTMVPNERQARELAPLRDNPDQLRETWQRANDATGGKPTAAAVREARERVRPSAPRPADHPATRPPEPVARPPLQPAFSDPDQPHRTPTPDAADTDLGIARYREAFVGALRRATILGDFDSERVAETVTGHSRDSAIELLDGIISSAERHRNALRRSVLRVMEGGRR